MALRFAAGRMCVKTDLLRVRSPIRSDATSLAGSRGRPLVEPAPAGWAVRIFLNMRPNVKRNGCFFFQINRPNLLNTRVNRAFEDAIGLS